MRLRSRRRFPRATAAITCVVPMLLILIGCGDTRAKRGAGAPGSDSLARSVVRPTPLPSGTTVMVAAGDISSCRNDRDEATARLVDSIPGIVAVLGDNVYENGTAAEFAECYEPTWGRHKARTRPAVGNHEYRTDGASAYFTYFGDAAGDPDKGYYSYDAGSWHVIVLNSNCARVSCRAGSEQETWLRADLQANADKACTLAYFHHPRFNSGDGHGNNGAVAPFWNALYEYGADVILTGHEHLYERFAPQRPDAVPDPARGIRQFTVGTGGRSFYRAGNAKANSEIRNGSTSGVLRLALHSGSYAWQFVPVAGESFTDSGSARCH